MLRFLAIFGAAFLGYLVMAVVAVCGIAATWFSLGVEFAFAEDTNVASTSWCLVILAGNLVAAVAGGAVTTLVAGRKPAPAIVLLVSMVFVLGVVTLAMQATAEPKSLPEGKSMNDLTFAEAGQFATNPMWYNVATIGVGVSGIVLGARLVRRNRLDPANVSA